MLRSLRLCVVLFAVAGCHPNEGERCNPMLFSDECKSGFACTVPQRCAVAYCCPTIGTSSSANCQACPDSDGGASD